MKIFLDLDGCIRDFSQGVFDWFNVPPFEETHYTHIIEYITRLFDISEGELWESLRSDFWAGLPKTPFADDLLKILEPYKPTILTKPCGLSASGTQRWIYKHFPEYFHGGRYVITPDKTTCANKNSLLIDDYDENCTGFIWAGGRAILVPRSYNKKRGKDPVETVKTELKKIVG